MIVREQSKSNPAEKYLSTFPLLFGSWDIRSDGDGQRRLGQGDISLDRDVFAPLLRDKIKSATQSRHGALGSWLECLA